MACKNCTYEYKRVTIHYKNKGIQGTAFRRGKLLSLCKMCAPQFSNYGMSSARLKSTIKTTAENKAQAKAQMNQYYESYPTLKKLTEK